MAIDALHQGVRFADPQDVAPCREPARRMSAGVRLVRSVTPPWHARAESLARRSVSTVMLLGAATAGRSRGLFLPR